MAVHATRLASGVRVRTVDPASAAVRLRDRASFAPIARGKAHAPVSGNAECQSWRVVRYGQRAPRAGRGGGPRGMPLAGRCAPGGSDERSLIRTERGDRQLCRQHGRWHHQLRERNPAGPRPGRCLRRQGTVRRSRSGGGTGRRGRPGRRQRGGQVHPVAAAGRPRHAGSRPGQPEPAGRHRRLSAAGGGAARR